MSNLRLFYRFYLPLRIGRIFMADPTSVEVFSILSAAIFGMIMAFAPASDLVVLTNAFPRTIWVVLTLALLIAQLITLWLRGQHRQRLSFMFGVLFWGVIALTEIHSTSLSWWFYGVLTMSCAWAYIRVQADV